jgi:2-polyprenyl-3-methyl-5-hydroxy-6-metoxy-1,4-benzoquinol methylase
MNLRVQKMNFVVPNAEIEKLTGLKGYRLYTHQKRKKHLIDLIIKYFSPGFKILDVGCANGDIAVELADKGYKVHGIDFEKVRLNNAKNLASQYEQVIKFENKSFEELSYNNKYEVVLLGEVLEHFNDPVDILRKIQALLCQNGRVVITTPNMPSMRNRIKFGILGIFPDNNPEHKFYFDYKRFSDVILTAGYKLNYFKTKFTNIQYSSKNMARIEDILLSSWFTYLFPHSGDTIFGIISPKQNNYF